MPQDYTLKLTGFVGDTDFDAKEVRRACEQNAGKQMHVLIDSTGGFTNTGISISQEFQNHGNVTVHFTGLNASAATIASLGAKTITIDRKALYLVHKAKLPGFNIEELNSEGFAKIIRECEKNIHNLNRIDSTVAAMYATRCSRKSEKSPEQLLQLMEKDIWLTAEEALEWGFVDEITYREEDKAPQINRSIAEAMSMAGIPIPVLPGGRNYLSSILASVEKSVRSTINSIFSNMDKQKNELPDEKPDTTDGHQQEQPEKENPECSEEPQPSLQDQLDEKNREIEALKKEIEKLKAAPGDETSIVRSKGTRRTEEPDPFTAFASTTRSARSLYDSLP